MSHCDDRFSVSRWSGLLFSSQTQFVLVIRIPHFAQMLPFLAHLRHPFGRRRLFPPWCNKGRLRRGGEVQASR